MLSFVKKGVGFFLLIGGILGIILLNVLSSSCTGKTQTATTLSETETTTTTISSAEEATTLTGGAAIYYVDIKGEVANPGVYAVLAGTRVFEVVKMASGLTEEGDTSSVNLADEVSDGMVIYIPKKQSGSDDDDSQLLCVQIRGEVENPGIYYLEEGKTVADLISASGGLTSEADEEDIDTGLILSQGFSLVVPTTTQTSASTDSDEEESDLVNINTADLDTDRKSVV